MAKFLDTTGVSYHLQQLINNANEKLILISPFLKINERIRQSLEDKDRLKIDIRIIYGKNELQPEENNWLRSLQSIRSSFCKNLHAKCYMNENEAIITSMNLYEFSQINNNEMGIYLSKSEDSELYQNVYNEVMRLVRISDEIKISVEKVIVQEKNNDEAPVNNLDKGFCIRCKKDIQANLSQPYCPDCYKIWIKFKNRNYKEVCCHLCGKENGSTMNKPICLACYKKNNQNKELSSWSFCI